MAQRPSKVSKVKKGRRGRPATSGSFKPGHEAYHRSPDIRPRKQVVATMIMAALFQEQVRDPRTGRISRSKWNKPIAGAGMRDGVRYYARALYEGAHGDAAEAAQLAAGVVRLGDHFAAYLDDKPSGAPRVTTFVFSGQEPNREVPPEQGRRGLSPAEGPYEEIKEEDAP